MKFIQYGGDTMKLPTSKNHLNFKWLEPRCNILFSVCRQGNAASIHFTSDKNGLRKINQAVNEFCEFIFWIFDWCTMIFGNTKTKSAARVAKNCGFERLLSKGCFSIYVRLR